MKVVINKCFGGFSLSEKAILRYLELRGKKVWPEPDPKYKSLGNTYWLVPPAVRSGRDASREEWQSMTTEERIAHNAKYSEQVFYDRDVARDDQILVQVVEELGSDADGSCAALRVVEIPEGVDWEIDEYDGREHIAETHRTWP